MIKRQTSESASRFLDLSDACEKIRIIIKHRSVVSLAANKRLRSIKATLWTEWTGNSSLCLHVPLNSAASLFRSYFVDISRVDSLRKTKREEALEKPLDQSHRWSVMNQQKGSNWTNFSLTKTPALNCFLRSHCLRGLSWELTFEYLGRRWETEESYKVGTAETIFKF